LQVGIKVTGQLADYFDGDEVILPDGASVAEALATIGITADQVGLVAVNGESVARAQHGIRLLGDGDNMTVLAPLTGG
jgi:sulfur carrier protein|tara:strand:- start:32 stop:265 length:234 start_codon:yes stop_codon:yes gene_type:complete